MCCKPTILKAAAFAILLSALSTASIAQAGKENLQEKVPSSQKKTTSVQDITDELEKLNLEGKGFQSILDALTIKYPKFTSCKPNKDGRVRQIRLKPKTLRQGRGKSVTVMNIYNRTLGPDGVPTNISRAMVILDEPGFTPEQNLFAFTNALPLVLDGMCDPTSDGQSLGQMLSEIAEDKILRSLYDCEGEELCRHKILRDQEKYCAEAQGNCRRRVDGVRG